MLIHDYVRRASERAPESVFLVRKGVRTTYAEVDSASNRLARLLVDQGVRPGDRVGLLLPNTADYVVAYYGALKAGAISVSLHAGSDARTIRRLLHACGARAVIPSPQCLGHVVSLAPSLPDLRIVVTPRGMDETAGLPAHVRDVPVTAGESLEPSPPPGVRRVDLDPAMIVYTSGSTGRPRGAVLRHLNVVSNTRSIVEYLGLTARDRVSVVLPFPYVYGKSLLNTHASVGGSLVLHDSLVFPGMVLDEMDEEEVTGLAGVPSTFALLLNRSDLADRDLPALRYVTQAGGRMPEIHIRRLLEALPRARLFVMYGATEASARLSYLDPGALETKIGSIGKAIPNVDLAVRLPDGSEASTGEVGEIVARGSNIMAGYWGDADATAEVMDRYGFHTGDLGWRDEDGFLWITGRSREMIKSGAHRISPREIEEVLLECEVVDEAAVVGIADDFLGEAIQAHVSVRPGRTVEPDELREFCRPRLPAFKVPRDVVIHRSLPRTSSGKIDKRALRGSGGG